MPDLAAWYGWLPFAKSKQRLGHAPALDSFGAFAKLAPFARLPRRAAGVATMHLSGAGGTRRACTTPDGADASAHTKTVRTSGRNFLVGDAIRTLFPTHTPGTERPPLLEPAHERGHCCCGAVGVPLIVLRSSIAERTHPATKHDPLLRPIIIAIERNT